MREHAPISPIYRQGQCSSQNASRREERYKDVQHDAALQEIALIRLDDHRLGEYEGLFLRRLVAELTGVRM